MFTEYDPEDNMPTRASLAEEVLLSRIQLLSETFYSAGWIEDLEFYIWEMAHSSKPRFADANVSKSLAKDFRDLATLANGWWVWPDSIGKKGDSLVFIPLNEWEELATKR